MSVENQYQIWENNEEIRLFREYLKIPSVHPDVNYGITTTLSTPQY